LTENDVEAAIVRAQRKGSDSNIALAPAARGRADARFLFAMLERVDPRHPDEAVIARAAEILRRGGLVAFPTETVYGLGANALDPDAVDRIFAAKGRPWFNPLIVHVADLDRVRDVARDWPENAERLARAFWPGPLTLVVHKRPEVPPSVSGGGDTVGVRVPSHPVARALLTAAGIPVAAPSANRSNEVSPTTGSHVQKSLGEAVDLILDAGPTTVGIESTVVDVTQDPPSVLRPGMITQADLTRVVGEVVRTIIEFRPHPPRDEPRQADVGDRHARPSPGMLERHYAPRTSLLLVETGSLRRTIEDEERAGRRVGAILITVMTPSPPAHRIAELDADPAKYAAALYAVLHQLDEDTGVDVIVVERPPMLPEWFAVLDRLWRAAHR
jgi:L-threonylcarbamoyladenylate synthase